MLTLNQEVTVDVCGGRFQGKILGTKITFNNTLLYSISGPDIQTHSSINNINQVGKPTCSDMQCISRDNCNLLKGKNYV